MKLNKHEHELLEKLIRGKIAIQTIRNMFVCTAIELEMYVRENLLALSNELSQCPAVPKRHMKRICVDDYPPFPWPRRKTMR